MKNKFFILVILALSNETGWCQGCLPDGIVFSSQTQINNFKSGYPGCTEIGGDVLIKSFDGKDITNLNGLSDLTSIKGGLYIVFNDKLTGFTGLNNLTSVMGGLTLGYNHDVTNLSGLDNLAYVGGWIGILYNLSLTTFSGLNHLNSIGGGLNIAYNEVLNSIDALNTVTSIGDGIEIEGNMTLTSLAGLENIDAGSISNLVIKLNYSLSTCEVQSVCNYIANSVGTVEIGNNSAGCSSQDEVKAACGLVSVVSLAANEGISIYPNPSSTHVTINSPITFLNDDLIIFSYTGQQMIRKRITESRMVIDISYLPKGIYIVQINNSKAVSSCKFIKE
jgi:hypothetical protein